MLTVAGVSAVVVAVVMVEKESAGSGFGDEDETCSTMECGVVGMRARRLLMRSKALCGAGLDKASWLLEQVCMASMGTWSQSIHELDE